MAQLLNERHSVNVHLNTVRRHIRIAHQIKGAEELAATIEPHFNNLLEKWKVKNSYSEEVESKRDTVILKDALLDDKVRDLHEGCKKYDRDHPGLTITNQIFPGSLSVIIYAPLKSEPTEVEKLLIKVKELGAGHELAAFVAPLEQAISECKEALSDLQLAMDDEAKAKAHESFAKFNLARQYEQNYFDAGTKFGKQFASRLFPSIKSKKRMEEGQEPESEPKK
jgi:hypothetical protein